MKFLYKVEPPARLYIDLIINIYDFNSSID